MNSIEYRAYVNERVGLVKVDLIRFRPHHPSIFDFEWKDEDGYTRKYFGNYDETKLMQYTGLKDKHGIKIFEGDIVNHKYMYLSYTDYGNTDEITETTVIHDLTDLPFDQSTISVEIIGNVYENPELMEGSESNISERLRKSKE